MIGTAAAIEIRINIILPETMKDRNFFFLEVPAVFEALSGMASISVDNSSVLSGVWRGSFNISTSDRESTRLRSGASFAPENGRILIN